MAKNRNSAFAQPVRIEAVEPAHSLRAIPMRDVVITTAFGDYNKYYLADNKATPGGRPPLASCILVPGRKPKFIQMWVNGTGYTRQQIKQEQMKWIRDIFVGATHGEFRVSTHNFKQHLQSFDLPLDRYDVYDMPEYREIPLEQLEVIARKLVTTNLQEYQNIIANSAVAYQGMEKAGLKHNGTLCRPVWHPSEAITGRSSCTEFNIQGIPRKDDIEHIIHHPDDNENDFLLHFDWIAADLQMVAQLAEDEVLSSVFLEDDPYTCLAKVMEQPRNKCKIELLSSIHGLRLNSGVFSIFQNLGKWVTRCSEIIQQPDGYLESLLGRRFWVADVDERHKVLSHAIQGSTAHAMQLAVRRMWENQLVHVLAELHDSLVVSCSGANFKSVIAETQDIIFRPFGNLLDMPMPYRVSMCKVSKGWNNWEPVLECRNGKLTRLQ